MHLLIIHFSLLNYSGVLKISQKTQVSVLSSLKSFLNCSTVFSFEWALTHRSFPRILPDSCNFHRSYSQIHFKVDVRMNCHQSYAFLQDLSNKFHRRFNLSNCHSGVSQQFMVVFLIIILNIWGPKMSVSAIISVLLKTRDSSLSPSSHDYFRWWEFFSSFRSNSGVLSVIWSLLTITFVGENSFHPFGAI